MVVITAAGGNGGGDHDYAFKSFSDFKRFKPNASLEHGWSPNPWVCFLFCRVKVKQSKNSPNKINFNLKAVWTGLTRGRGRGGNFKNVYLLRWLFLSANFIFQKLRVKLFYSRNSPSLPSPCGDLSNLFFSFFSFLLRSHVSLFLSFFLVFAYMI